MTRTRSWLVASLVVLIALVSAPTGAQTPVIDVTGDWQITVNSPMGARTTPLSLKQDGEKVSGSFKSAAGELPVTGTLVDNELKLAFTLNVQGNPIDISLDGKVAGESITGMAQFGGFGEGEFTAKRGSAEDAPLNGSSATTTASTTPAATTSSSATSKATCRRIAIGAEPIDHRPSMARPGAPTQWNAAPRSGTSNATGNPTTSR
jgi:hypothetical protein